MAIEKTVSIESNLKNKKRHPCKQGKRQTGPTTIPPEDHANEIFIIK